MRLPKYKYDRKRVPIYFWISLLAFFLSLVLFVISEFSEKAADALNDTVSHSVRRLLAAFGDLFPFSLFELLIGLLPIIITLITVFAIRKFHSDTGRVRFVLVLFSVVLIIASEYLITLGIAYNTTTIDKKMGIEPVEVTEERLSNAMIQLRDELNLLAPEITYTESGESVHDSSFEEISEKLCESFLEIQKEYSFPKTFNSHAKLIYFGNVMSYFRLTGIYTFYTGEANVNSAYPQYDIYFTAAHELSHQRGILRENEANFMAYLVTSRSDDGYLRYSAALSMYEYIGSALYRTNKNSYYEIAAGLDERVLGDIKASSAVTERYGNTVLADISHFFNDLFLKSNGTAGVVTYGRVVELAVAYLENGEK